MQHTASKGPSKVGCLHSTPISGTTAVSQKNHACSSSNSFSISTSSTSTVLKPSGSVTAVIFVPIPGTGPGARVTCGGRIQCMMAAPPFIAAGNKWVGQGATKERASRIPPTVPYRNVTVCKNINSTLFFASQVPAILYLSHLSPNPYTRPPDYTNISPVLMWQRAVTKRTHCWVCDLRGQTLSI